MADGGRVTLRATPPLYSSDSSFLFRGSKSHAVAKRSSFVPLHVPDDRTRALNSQPFTHTSRFPIIRKWTRVTCQPRLHCEITISLRSSKEIVKNFFSPTFVRGDLVRRWKDIFSLDRGASILSVLLIRGVGTSK